MLVIHPKDKTTAMLSALYDGLEAQVIDDCRSTKEMEHLLRHVSTQERIMLLGHGSDKGLFFRFAKGHSNLTFLVTRIGCGIAGFRDEEIAPLFMDAIDVENIILPKEFVACLVH